jgi:UDP-3-O-[3-hydroxymyristoyl] glucosamine N-acyltransferase
MSVSYSIDRILEIVGGDATCVGDYTGNVDGIASLSGAQAGEISFLGNPKYLPQVQESKASVLLLPENYEGEPRDSQVFIRLEDPSYALALICRDIENSLYPRPPAGIHPTANIEAGAEVHPTATVGAFCHIAAGAQIEAQAVLENHVSVGRGARIGAESHLSPQVVVADRCIIGARNRLLSGCVIGADGFGYTTTAKGHEREPQIGNVETGQDVDVGSNTSIDRARFGTTQIGAGTKIDNLVQIAHNVRMGRDCLIVAQCGISGSTELGDNVILAGQSGVVGHLKVSDGTVLFAKSSLVNSTQANDKILGNPGISANLMSRIYVLQRKLPDLFKRFDQVEKYVESQKNNAD